MQKSIINITPRVVEKTQNNKVGKTNEIKTISASEIYRLNPQPEPIVEGFLVKGENTIIHGGGGIGKSTFSLQIATRLAAQPEPFGNLLFDTFKIKKFCCQSLFVQSENSMSAVNTKIRFMVGDDRTILSKLHFPMINDDILTIDGSFDNQLFQQQCIDTINIIEDSTQSKVDLLIIDPFVSFHRAEENSSGDMRYALDGITKVSQKSNCTTIIIHHDNKQNDYRGSSAINDWARSRISLKRSFISEGQIINFDDEDKPITSLAKIPAIEMVHEKANNMPLFEQVTFVLTKKLLFKKISNPISSKILERCIEVQQALKSLGGMAESNNLLAKATSKLTGRSKNTCKKDISIAVKNNYIKERKTKPGVTHAVQYCLPQQWRTGVEK